MIKNYESPTEVTHTHSEHVFAWADEPSAGYAFPVDEHMQVIINNPAAAANYQKCRQLSRTGDIIDKGIHTYEHLQFLPATGTCHCGEHLHLDGDTTCECGRIYNSAGQELAYL